MQLSDDDLVVVAQALIYARSSLVEINLIPNPELDDLYERIVEPIRYKEPVLYSDTFRR